MPTQAETRSTKYPLGILGGMGPYGHVALEFQLLRAAQRRVSGFIRDQQYPEWVLLSRSRTPERTACILEADDACFLDLRRGLEALLELGAESMVIPCITAHHWIEPLRARFGERLRDLVELTVRHLATQPARRVMVLGTCGTLRSAIFERAARRCDAQLNIAYPAGEHDLSLGDEVLTRAISDIKSSGRIEPEVLSPLVALCDQREIDTVVLACTELCFVSDSLRDVFAGLGLVDPLELFAERFCAEFFAKSSETVAAE